jgi:hypothetical protein
MDSRCYTGDLLVVTTDTEAFIPPWPKACVAVYPQPVTSVGVKIDGNQWSSRQSRLVTGVMLQLEAYWPPWSLVLTPSDSSSLHPLKSTWFTVVANRKQLVTSWLQTLDTDIFCAMIKTLLPQWDKCLNLNSDFAENLCVPPANHCKVRIKLLALECLLTYL